MSAFIQQTGLPELAKFLEAAPEITRKAARLSLNQTTQRKAMPRFRKAMTEEVAFPAGYLSEDRLGITKKATDNDLSVAVTGRFRPTSLARFAQGQTIEGARRQKGVRVRVHRNKFIKGAFFVRLRRGGDTQDGYNLGLAIRLKPGQRITGRKKGNTARLGPNLYLLYGPSVDQVFKDVATSESGAVLDDLDTEFLRQFLRLSGDAA